MLQIGMERYALVQIGMTPPQGIALLVVMAIAGVIARGPLCNLTLELCACTSLGIFLLTCVEWRPSSPEIYGGIQMTKILQAVPLLSKRQSHIQLPSTMQLVLIALTNIVGRCPHIFHREEVPVHLTGDSVIENTRDSVALEWLDRTDLPEDAPIIVIVPGLANTKESLPGHSLYGALLERPWRVVVFEKRGVGHGKGNLQAPVFHLFGHPSDLHQAVLHIRKRFPKATLHFVSFSAGNGLLSSYFRIYGHHVRDQVSSAIMLMGGEDYNRALKIRQTQWSDVVVEERLHSFIKNYFLKSNEGILKRHNPEAYCAALDAESLHDLYLITMRCFSGYRDLAEAERCINGSWGGNGGNEWFLENRIPSLGILTKDDPVGWQLHPQWLDVVCRSPLVALAVFQYGSHCACFSGWRLARWIDELVVQWVDAFGI